ncbi:major type 1 subunit fimbrin (pilin) [Rahnella sp. BIGb0236]|uniref:fimbrial protein n=1 Tax=Rahnella sp. BIGb0236 TaxID=2485117 RepID=UPI0010F1D7B4|nr:fimbrial protein [Rahnella sp. BIGb0236]TDS83341.1 major type 1 subunit fimbrin (pilin) [Rahnella sp. BIGb0236]
MKKLNIAFAATTLALILGQQAYAADGTITFNGEVTDVTCTVSAGTGADTTIKLPTVAVSAFGSLANTTAGATPFAISLTGCASTAGALAQPKSVAVYFEPGSNVNANGRLNNTVTTGGATNVDIALYQASANTTPLVLGKIPSAGYSTISSTAPATTMNFLAKYYSTDVAVTSGLVSSNVTYSIVYP